MSSGKGTRLSSGKEDHQRRRARTSAPAMGTPSTVTSSIQVLGSQIAALIAPNQVGHVRLAPDEPARALPGHAERDRAQAAEEERVARLGGRRSAEPIVLDQIGEGHRPQAAQTTRAGNIRRGHGEARIGHVVSSFSNRCSSHVHRSVCASSGVQQDPWPVVVLCSYQRLPKTGGAPGGRLSSIRRARALCGRT